MLSPAPCQTQPVGLMTVLNAVPLPLATQSIRTSFTQIVLEKDKAVSECLSREEEAVDAFLTNNYGFDHSAIPFNYLDQPPVSLARVDENLNILLHCLAEIYLPQSPVRVMVMDTMRRVLYRDLLYPLKERLANLLLLDELLPEERRKVSADVEHLGLMEALEDTFLDEKHQSGGLSHVVPICGLVASRIHRLENEARTVLTHWRRR